MSRTHLTRVGPNRFCTYTPFALALHRDTLARIAAATMLLHIRHEASQDALLYWVKKIFLLGRLLIGFWRKPLAQLDSISLPLFLLTLASPDCLSDPFIFPSFETYSRSLPFPVAHTNHHLPKCYRSKTCHQSRHGRHRVPSALVSNYLDQLSFGSFPCPTGSTS